MAAVAIKPVKRSGPWTEGFVLDRHSVSSTPLGYSGPHLQFETTRTELGELVYRLKYSRDKRAIPAIVDTVVQFLQGWNPPIDCIAIPPPSDTTRPWQPVESLAREVAARLGIPMCDSAVTKTTETPPMKNIDDWSERRRLLAESIQAGAGQVSGLRVLLFDDLIQSGSTLARVTELLRSGGAAAVYALILTRTK